MAGVPEHREQAARGAANLEDTRVPARQIRREVPPIPVPSFGDSLSLVADVVDVDATGNARRALIVVGVVPRDQGRRRDARTLAPASTCRAGDESHGAPGSINDDRSGRLGKPPATDTRGSLDVAEAS